MLLINFYNQQGAGPAVITRQFLRHLPDSENIHVIVSGTHGDLVDRFDKINFTVLPTGALPLKFIVRLIFIPLVILWLGIRHDISKYIVFGNFSLLPVGRRKIILVQHAFLFDMAAIFRLPVAARMLEFVKYYFFRFQILLKRKSDVYVVQSEYMQKIFGDAINGILPVIISNPISEEFLDQDVTVSDTSGDSISLAYISRFYPHKNHILLFDLIDRFRKKEVPVEVYVTVDREIDTTKDFLARTEHYPEIINIGEVDHKRLVEIYRKVDATVFLSDLESFGNPIIESLSFEKPVLGLDRDYLKMLTPSILHSLFSDNIKELADNILKLLTNHSFHDRVLDEIRTRKKNLLPPGQWVARYLEL